MQHRALTLALLLCLSPLVHAQQDPASTGVTAAQRRAVVSALADQLQAKYVFPDAAKTLAAALRAREKSGAYAKADSVVAFVDTLTEDLRTLGKDGHFDVMHAPDFTPRDPAQVPTADDVDSARRQGAHRGYGIDSLARLPGNVGYFELRGFFGPTEVAADALSAAMTVLSGTDALIVDLRRNGGGEPNTVAYLMSHFFAKGDERHLNDLYSRANNSTRQYWTSPSVSVRYTKPVYVLTSKRTFSGGEEFAYDMQTQKRGVIVGESTGGGSNPGELYPLAEGYVAFIPDGRAINPITKTNWEHVGVKPDIAVPAADAQRVAHAAILRELISASKNPDEKAALQDSLKDVETGIVAVPVYAKHR